MGHYRFPPQRLSPGANTQSPPHNATKTPPFPQWLSLPPTSPPTHIYVPKGGGKMDSSFLGTPHFQGTPYSDELPPSYVVSTTHRPRTPTQGILSTTATHQPFQALRPRILRRDADFHVVRNCSEQEMKSRRIWGGIVEHEGLGDEFRPNLPKFKSVVNTRQSRGRQQEPEMSSSLQRNPNLNRQRNPSLPRQRSRSRSRARTAVPGDEASPPVPALPSMHRGAPRNDEANPPVPAVPSEHRAHAAAPESVRANSPSSSPALIISTRNASASPPDSAIDMRSRDGSLSTQSTQQSRASSTAEPSRVSTGGTSITAICSSSPTRTLSIPSRPSITPMLARTPTNGNLTLPEAALPPRHVDFDASCSSRPASSRAPPTTLIAKIKTAFHELSKCIAHSKSQRKDKEYCKQQRERELESRRDRNRLLDQNNRVAMAEIRAKGPRMKDAVKAQKEELARCKRVDKEGRKRDEKERKVQERREREGKKDNPLRWETEKWFGWGCKVDGEKVKLPFVR